MSTSFRHSNSKSYLWIPLVLVIAVSCSVNSSESEPDTECILQEIKFDDFNSLKFRTISGGRIFNLTQEFTSNGETEIVESFQFRYAPDSIAIQDQNDPFSIYPFVSVRLENERPVQVVKFFSPQGVRLIHDIDYSDPNQIRIDLTRIVSFGDEFYEGYSIYHLDSNGNVIRNERFETILNEPGEFIKFEDRFYIYDNFRNPQQNLYLPFFADRNFPDVKFFSPNNIQSFTENEQLFQFQNIYGDDHNLVSQILPSGQSIRFGYVNCP